MAQLTLSDLEYSLRRKKTKRERFLSKMDRVVPWKALEETVRPYYPSGKRGRPPRGLETMLRMYLLQYWFGLSDEAVEDAIYDSYAMRTFMRLDFFQQQVPQNQHRPAADRRRRGLPVRRERVLRRFPLRLRRSRPTCVCQRISAGRRWSRPAR